MVPPLTAKGIDLTLGDMYELTDAFFIGGTKSGALLGEALVLKNADLKEEFQVSGQTEGGRCSQRGRVLGIQFEVLFGDGTVF